MGGGLRGGGTQEIGDKLKKRNFNIPWEEAKTKNLKFNLFKKIHEILKFFLLVSK